MGRVADRIMDTLAGEVESRTGWDEPPALFFLYLEGGECRASALPLPDEIWAMDAPPASSGALPTAPGSSPACSRRPRRRACTGRRSAARRG